MRREYTSVRAGAFSIDPKVNGHLAERAAAGWTLEHVTTIRSFLRGYEFSFFWVREN
jgi:hypothetical protein